MTRRDQSAFARSVWRCKASTTGNNKLEKLNTKVKTLFLFWSKIGSFSFASMKSVKILVKKWLRNVRVIRWPDSIRNLYLWRTNQFVSLTIRTHRYNWRSNALKKANTSITTVSLRVKPTKIMKACKIK